MSCLVSYIASLAVALAVDMIMERGGAWCRHEAVPVLWEGRRMLRESMAGWMWVRLGWRGAGVERQQGRRGAVAGRAVWILNEAAELVPCRVCARVLARVAGAAN